MHTLKTLYDIACQHLDFVYLGNIQSNFGMDTYCPQCNSLLIKRIAYHTETPGLDGNGNCQKCNYILQP